MSLILHPEYEEYKLLYYEYKKTLLNLITKRDYLVKTKIPNLNALYLQQFGELLIEKLEAEHHYLRLKRKIELIQSLINTQQKVDYKRIEEILDNEYSYWQGKILQMIKEKEIADNWFNNCYTAEESEELRQKYREIVKRLHPDLNPNLKPIEIDLWHKTQEAYQMGNLEEIRRIYLLLNNLTQAPEYHDSNDIKAQVDLLKENIDLLRQKIEDMRNNFPLNFEVILNDARLLNSEKDKIRKQIEQFKSSIDSLNNHLSYLELINTNEQHN